MRGHSVSKILHFHLYISSIHQLILYRHVLYDAETIMIKQKIQKTNTEHLKSLSKNRGNFFFLNITQPRKPLDQIYTTSLLDFFHFTLLFFNCLFLSSTGTTARCTPSIFVWYLVLGFHLKPLSDKQCPFDINRLGVKEKLHNSRICEFDISFCCCFTGGFEGWCAASLESVGLFMVHQCGSEGKALERKSSSVNTGFVFYVVLMAGLAKRMLCVWSSLALHSSDLER